MEKLRLGKQGSWPGSQRSQAHQRQGHAPGWARRGRGTLAEGSSPGVHPGPQAAHRGSKSLLEWTLGRGPVPGSVNLPSPPRAHLFPQPPPSTRRHVRGAGPAQGAAGLGSGGGDYRGPGAEQALEAGQGGGTSGAGPGAGTSSLAVGVGAGGSSLTECLGAGLRPAGSSPSAVLRGRGLPSLSLKGGLGRLFSPLRNGGPTWVRR